MIPPLVPLSNGEWHRAIATGFGDDRPAAAIGEALLATIKVGGRDVEGKDGELAGEVLVPHFPDRVLQDLHPLRRAGQRALGRDTRPTGPFVPAFCNDTKYGMLSLFLLRDGPLCS